MSLELLLRVVNPLQSLHESAITTLCSGGPVTIMRKIVSAQSAGENSVVIQEARGDSWEHGLEKLSVKTVISDFIGQNDPPFLL